MQHAKTEAAAREERKAVGERLRQLQEAAAERGEEEEEEEEEVTDDRVVRGFRNHIVEEVLNLKCPNCRLVFVDYDGCHAVRCESRANSQYGCKSYFCPICLQVFADSGATHNHIRTAHGWEDSVFNATHRARQAASVRHFLSTQVPAAAAAAAGGGGDLRRRVWEELREDLLGLGIDPEDVWTG